MAQAKTQTRRERSRELASDDTRAWTTKRVSGMDIITAQIFNSVPWLVHGFSTRKGGESQLDGERVLNLGFTEWDSRQAVIRNRAKFVQSAGAAKMPLIALRQIHSDAMHVVSAARPDPPQGDAIATREPGLLLGIQTADCVPILLVDVRNRAVAAVHAGWRGTLNRIAAKALGRMRAEFGTRPADVLAALGPGIRRCCYEVGPEVAQAYLGQFPNAADWFDGPFDRLSAGEEPNPLPWLTMMPPGKEPPPERVQLDLHQANRWQLTDAGVPAHNIATSELCTACRTDMLFSYRREGPRTGRLMAAIGIKEHSS